MCSNNLTKQLADFGGVDGRTKSFLKPGHHLHQNLRMGGLHNYIRLAPVLYYLPAVPLFRQGQLNSV